MVGDGPFCLKRQSEVRSEMSEVSGMKNPWGEMRLTDIISYPLPHPTLSSFEASLPFVDRRVKHFTLVVLDSPNQNKILMGLKNRGFGKGLYNSFGGKVEDGEDVVTSAVREVKEETGLDVEYEMMRQGRIGVLSFTFDDNDLNMVVNLFKINFDKLPHNQVNYECEEITPIMIKYKEIPFNNMFADDSIWLPMVMGWRGCENKKQTGERDGGERERDGGEGERDGGEGERDGGGGERDGGEGERSDVGLVDSASGKEDTRHGWIGDGYFHYESGGCEINRVMSWHMTNHHEISG
eukprot:GHVN01011390.1.p1 GENE.GHVN01011390.1~~GHVN01011390.1.p1  ORF type:complete len:295 (-),score=104.52 GHVN01011390.1:339-1223(-)